MHYKTDGSFVGQFGLPRLDGSKDTRPGGGNNVHNFSVIKSGGKKYLYTHDEWSHGMHRWLLRAK